MQANVLEIVTLGGISIRSNGKLVTGFVSRKAEALLTQAVTALYSLNAPGSQPGL